MAYANKTTVPIERSQGEIRKILAKYSATGFAFGEQASGATVMFEMAGRRFRFNLPLPAPPSKGATKGSVNTYQQACRSLWRSLTLAIKAKLECVDAGIESLESAFMANIVLPSGQTVGQVIIPQIKGSYESGKLPPLLGYHS